ncbi:EpsG family protein [Weissella paramesenteroides]|uniref:EpsG family protein n=1 Tax=Weissella paramesenteroides TaxID=1249 RepID=UPI003F1ED2C0
MSLIYSYVVNTLFLKSKYIGGVFSFLLAIFLGVYAGNMPLNSMDDVAQSDIRSYFGNYSNPYSTNFEIGYRFISHFFFQQGVDYYTFRLVFSIVMMIVLWCVVTYLSNCNATLFFSLYSIFPFFVDTIQFRTMIASIFIVIAYFFLTKKNILFTILSLLFGTLFQSLTIVFLLTIPLYFFKVDNTFKRVNATINYIIFPLFIIFFSYLFGVLTWLVKLIAPVIGRDDLLAAYMRLSVFKTRWWDMFIYLIIFILELFVLYFIYNDKVMVKKHSSTLQATAPFLLIGIYALPIIKFFVDINRFFRLSEIILFILVALYFNRRDEKGVFVKDLITYILVFFLTVLSAYVFYKGSDFPHIVNILQLNG